MKLETRIIENKELGDKCFLAFDNFVSQGRVLEAFKSEFLVDADLRKGNYREITGSLITGSPSLIIIKKEVVESGVESSAEYTLIGDKGELDKFYREYLGIN